MTARESWYDRGHRDGLASHSDRLPEQPPQLHPEYVRGWRAARAEIRGASPSEGMLHLLDNDTDGGVS